MAASIRPRRVSSLAMPVKCSVRLRRSISASRRKASAASARLPADSRTRAANVHAGIDRGSICDGLLGRSHRLGQLAVGFEIAGQHVPLLGRRILGAHPHLCVASRSASAIRPAAWSFFTPGFQDGCFFFVFLGELVRGGQLGFGLVIAFEPVQIVGQLEPVVEIVGVELDGLGERRDRLFQIAEAGEDLGQPRQVFGVLVRAVGDFGPGGLRFVGTLEIVEVFADIFMILGIGRCQLGGLSCRGPGRRRSIPPGATGRRPARW